MSKIKNKKQFLQNIDSAFKVLKSRDEAKAAYIDMRKAFEGLEEELCAFADEHPAEAYTESTAAGGRGETDCVSYVFTKGRSLVRIDGGSETDETFLKKLPKEYVRMKPELNKAKLKSSGLTAAELKKLGFKYRDTLSLKLKAKAAA